MSTPTTIMFTSAARSLRARPGATTCGTTPAAPKRLAIELLDQPMHVVGDDVLDNESAAFGCSVF